jgi:hypothetical protein
VNAVELYFAQRELILTEQDGKHDAINDWYQQDLNEHLTAIKTVNAVRLDSEISIDNIILGKYTTVSLRETVTYLVNGANKSEIIQHELILIGSNNTYTMMDDAYYESVTNFASCAYIPTNTISPLATGDGSALCIIQVAQNEVGYIEGDGNTSIYGKYFGKNGKDWCVMFVVWCAIHADVPLSVIPNIHGTHEFYQFFDNKNHFNLAPSEGGSPNPIAGDIIFFRGADTNEDGIRDAFTGHVGIVTGYSGSTVYYIDGNGYPNYNCVQNATTSINSYLVVGFGRPQYSKSSHTSNTWKTNASQHWKACENCNTITVKKTAHSMYTDPLSGATYCTICNYGRDAVINRMKHKPIILDS